MAATALMDIAAAPRNAPSFAAKILLADETLRTIFLLNHAQSSEPAALTDDRASRLLLWFAASGWRRYPKAVFSPAYLSFLSAPAPPYESRLAAYLFLTRSDLRERFGDNLGAFHAWYYAEGAARLGVAPFVSAKERLSFPTAATRDGTCDAPLADRTHLPGANVIGFGDNVMGIGEDVRALDAALGRAGLSRSVISISLPSEFGTLEPPGPTAPRGDRPIFPINIFAMPPFETARLRIERGPAMFDGRYSIGYWPWELTSLPEHWRRVFDLVDEIWAASEFLVEVFGKLTGKPVVLMPPYLNIPPPEPIELSRWGIGDDDIVFLVMFDFNSFVDRKNPEGAIEAFRKAFPSGGRERLLLKSINAHARPHAARRIADLASTDPRIVAIDDALSRPQTMGLVRRADCLISLHRGEGFGRVIAEAMALGTAVVATNWSGPTSFLNAMNGYPVDYALRDVAPGEYAFSHGGRWAEPSIDDAALKLREARRRLGGDDAMRARARAFVNETYGLDIVAAALAGRIEAIAARRPDLLL